MSEEKRLYTMTALSRIYEIPYSTIRRWVFDQRFPIFRSGSRVYIDKRRFDAFIDSGGDLYEAGKSYGELGLTEPKDY